MDSHNNLHFKSILSKWTDFCGLWDMGEDGWGTFVEDGGGEGICPERWRGIHTISKYYPACVTKGEKSGPKRAVSQQGGSWEIWKEKAGDGEKEQVAKGCKQMTRCDKWATQVTKITANAHELQMLHQKGDGKEATIGWMKDNIIRE